MNTGDVKAGRTSSEEWLATSSADPNAALWASITPPPSPSLATVIRRRLAALAPDLLAQRLYLGFPHYFASPLAASRALLAGVAALGAGVGLAGYLVAGTFLGAPADEAGVGSVQARAAATIGAERSGVTTNVADTAGGAQPEAVSPAPARAAPNALADDVAPALANTAALEPEQFVQTLRPSSAGEERSQLTSSKPKKRAHARKKVKARAKARAKAAASLEMEAAAPERSAAPPRARPRRQAAFKFN
jgi:hypothetical protein